jgi:hypothetical protein
MIFFTKLLLFCLQGIGLFQQIDTFTSHYTRALEDLLQKLIWYICILFILDFLLRLGLDLIIFGVYSNLLYKCLTISHHNLTTTAEFVLYFLNVKVCLWSFYWFSLSTHFLAFTTVLVFPLYAASFVSLQLQLSKVECDGKRHSILYVGILRYADKSRAKQFTLAKVL